MNLSFRQVRSLFVFFIGLQCLSSVYGLNLTHSNLFPYRYGGGVDPDFPFAKKENCLEFDPIHQIDQGSGVSHLRVESHFVSSKKNELELLKAHTGVKASAFWNKYKLSGEYSLTEETERKITQDDQFLVITVEGDFGRKSSKDFRLKPEYQALLDRGAHQELIRRCGSYYIGMAYSTVSVVATVRASGINQTFKNKILRDVGFSMDTPYATSEGKFTIDLALEKMSDYATLDITFEANAGKGFVDIGKLVQTMHKADYESIVSAMGNYVSGIDVENTPPTSYEAYPMTEFGIMAEEQNAKKQKFLENVYLEYLNTLSFESELKKLDSKNSYSFSYQRQILLGHKKRLERLGMECYDFGRCEGVVPTLRDLNFDLAQDLQADLKCSYTKTDKNKLFLLSGLSVDIRGRFPFIENIKLSSVQLFSDDESKKGKFTGPYITDLSVSPQYDARQGPPFILFSDAERLFEERKIPYTVENREKARHFYQNFLQKNYYLKVNSNQGHSFLYYIGPVSGSCDIERD